ncbi:3'-5' exonuclease [Leptolyngbya ohadii]|uniref:3'-5' exonuclease n=1 Tax=Leptolyngbya ohadii TaxID=1962290 RepID=UPI000B59AD73|nr:3'-5' exonuclease [Leptolyngbya ohadii]
MTTWAISVADTFLNELLNLPQAVSKKVSKAIKVLQQDPISAKGDAKKLKGYENNIYRVRIGDYRLIYSFGQGWVKLLSVRKRDDRTYEIELPDFETPSPLPQPAVLEPQTAGNRKKSRSAVNSPLPAPQSVDLPSVHPASSITTALPFSLTKSLLKQWQIPTDYWNDLLRVESSESLLDLTIPDRYLSRILDNLYPRPLQEIATQREYVLTQPEDLDRFVEGSLSAFLLKLDPEQEKLKDFGTKGPTLVKGGPGTGKSTLALYRVQRLLEQGCKPILFTTYTKALVTYSQQLLEQLLGQSPKAAGVEVTTVDAIARHYYAQSIGQPYFARPDQCLGCLEAALQTADIPGTNPFDRQVRRQTLQRLGTTYLLQEIQDVIEAWGIADRNAYLHHDRKGRGVPLKANLREAVWAVYLTWRDLMAQKGYITWEQLRLKALDIVQSLPQPPYQAVVIDEAQDLSPVALRFLLALVPSFDGIYLTADASQSLYQRGFNWKQVHTDLKVTGRTLVLRRNYRNTQQIAAACTTILQDTEAGDPDCIVQQLSPYQGDVPSICLSDSSDREVKAIQTFLINAAKQFRLPIHGGAVLCPNGQLGKTIAQKLVDRGLKAQFVTGDQIDIHAPYVKVLTLHSAKGLEFPFVVVVGLQEGKLPFIPSDVPPDEVFLVTDEQRRLFYVGCSRAMRSLLVCGSQAQPSQFLAALIPPHWQR